MKQMYFKLQITQLIMDDGEQESTTELSENFSKQNVKAACLLCKMNVMNQNV